MRRRAVFLTLIAVFATTLYLTSSNTSASSNSAKPVTFSKDVAPILYKACVQCHRAGDFAPMSLITYKEARPWARSIREKVVGGEMPPWPADPKHGEFANERKLSQREIDTISSWVDQGAPEGNPKDLPPAPQFAEGWRVGKPDVVLTMPEEFTLAATSRKMSGSRQQKRGRATSESFTTSSPSFSLPGLTQQRRATRTAGRMHLRRPSRRPSSSMKTGD
jgi:hypothetical protein